MLGVIIIDKLEPPGRWPPGLSTEVIVTHNMQQAALVSDFTAFFFQGWIEEFGPTHELFTTPKN